MQMCDLSAILEIMSEGRPNYSFFGYISDLHELQFMAAEIWKSELIF